MTWILLAALAMVTAGDVGLVVLLTQSNKRYRELVDALEVSDLAQVAFNAWCSSEGTLVPPHTLNAAWAKCNATTRASWARVANAVLMADDSVQIPFLDAAQMRTKATEG